MSELDWGDSGSGGQLATLKEVHSHRKDERGFQLRVVSIFAGLSLVCFIIQAINASFIAKDAILTLAPIFTFILGKSEAKSG